MLLYLIAAGMFFLLGILFSFGKGAGLIAGYNTSSAAEKAKYDEHKLCKGMAKLMFAFAACWLVTASGEIFRTRVLLWIGVCLFIVVSVAGLIYMNTGNRYKKQL